MLSTEILYFFFVKAMPDHNIFVSSFSLSYMVVVLLPKSIFLFGACNEVNFFKDVSLSWLLIISGSNFSRK